MENPPIKNRQTLKGLNTLSSNQFFKMPLDSIKMVEKISKRI